MQLVSAVHKQAVLNFADWWVVGEHGYVLRKVKYEGWNFNFGNTPLDWIQELPE